MTGHLHLVCAADECGRSYLREQSFSAPMHISKPHEDAGVLVVNAVNPTAGLFSGDHVTIRVQVEKGARLLLTSPSATRVHATGDGKARFEQEFAVADGGFLEVLPELFIPQAGARYEQRSRARVEDGGTLIFCETLAPGRVASGEEFAFASLDWDTRIALGDRETAREKYLLAPDDESLTALRTLHPRSYFGSVFVIGDWAQNCLPHFRSMECEGAVLGATQLVRGGIVAKILAVDSVVLRKVMNAIRAIIYAQLERPVPALRRF